MICAVVLYLVVLLWLFFYKYQLSLIDPRDGIVL